jgi:hypothetical protein
MSLFWLLFIMAVICPSCHQTYKNTQGLSLHRRTCPKARSTAIAFLKKYKRVAECQKEASASTSGASGSNDAQLHDDVRLISFPRCIETHFQFLIVHGYGCRQPSARRQYGHRYQTTRRHHFYTRACHSLNILRSLTKIPGTLYRLSPLPLCSSTSYARASSSTNTTKRIKFKPTVTNANTIQVFYPRKR